MKTRTVSLENFNAKNFVLEGIENKDMKNFVSQYWHLQHFSLSCSIEDITFSDFKKSLISTMISDIQAVESEDLIINDFDSIVYLLNNDVAMKEYFDNYIGMIKKEGHTNIYNVSIILYPYKSEKLIDTLNKEVITENDMEYIEQHEFVKEIKNCGYSGRSELTDYNWFNVILKNGNEYDIYIKY